MDPPIHLLRRQYFQLFEPDFISWPPKQLLRDAGVQEWLYTHLFDSTRNDRLPPERYQIRILKPLISKIEGAIQDPDQDEISDSLISHLSRIMSTTLPTEFESVQRKTNVTFTCLAPSSASLSSPPPTPEPTVTLLERPHLISGSQTTGFRTWEASLHLGTYLLSHPSLITNKSVLELGAGTGFISILCARHLAAAHVTATDGDEGVIEALKENIFINDLEVPDGNSQQARIGASVLRWGTAINGVGSWVEDDVERWPYDVVLGADITYDKRAIFALVSTLRSLFLMRPRLLVLIAGAVRNTETFETFWHACVKQNFRVVEVDFQPKPIREQTALFYATAVPLKIVSIRSPQPES